MLLIKANTYMEGYGSQIYSFGLYNTEEECINYMNNYNNLVKEFLANYKKLIKHKPRETYDDNDNLENIDKHMAFDDKLENFIKGYKDKGIIIPYGLEYGFNEGTFTFNMDNPALYILNITNNKPQYFGGYCE